MATLIPWLQGSMDHIRRMNLAIILHEPVLSEQDVVKMPAKDILFLFPQIVMVQVVATARPIYASSRGDMGPMGVSSYS